MRFCDVTAALAGGGGIEAFGADSQLYRYPGCFFRLLIWHLYFYFLYFLCQDGWLFENSKNSVLCGVCVKYCWLGRIKILQADP
jgi:hypothetical protein